MLFYVRPPYASDLNFESPTPPASGQFGYYRASTHVARGADRYNAPTGARYLEAQRPEFCVQVRRELLYEKCSRHLSTS